jgi:hypothetical protein
VFREVEGVDHLNGGTANPAKTEILAERMSAFPWDSG